MAKLTAQGYELVPPARYALEVTQAKPVKEYGPQLEARLRIAEGQYEGFEFVDYPNRGVEDGVKVGTKAWDLFEACLTGDALHPLRCSFRTVDRGVIAVSVERSHLRRVAYLTP
jgi:hypothetical protein